MPLETQAVDQPRRGTSLQKQSVDLQDERNDWMLMPRSIAWRYNCASLGNLATVLAEHDGEHEAARGLYERCLALRSDDANTHSNLANLL